MKKFLTLFLILSIVFTLGCKKDQPVEVIEQEKIREEQGVNKINSLGPVDTIKSMYQSLKNGDLDTFHFLSENILEKINEDDSFLEYLVERLDFMDEQLIEELQESEIETSYLYILENEYGNYADDFVVVVEYSNLPYAAWGWVLKHTETGLKVVDLTRAYIGEIVKGGMMPEEIEKIGRAHV